VHSYWAGKTIKYISANAASTAMIQKFLNIIRHYRESDERDPDSWVLFCKKQKTLYEAIYVASMAINHLGNRHPHQFRLMKSDLRNFENSLAKQEKLIGTIKSFEDLFQIVKCAKVHGIGELAIYDTAHRLGAFLNIFPEKIYLHSGTLVGATKLIGKINSRVITKQDLPEPFKSSDLTCMELEDILCIYKRRF